MSNQNSRSMLLWEGTDTDEVMTMLSFAEWRLLEPSSHARIPDTGVHGEQGNQSRGERPAYVRDALPPQHSAALSQHTGSWTDKISGSGSTREASGTSNFVCAFIVGGRTHPVVNAVV